MAEILFTLNLFAALLFSTMILIDFITEHDTPLYKIIVFAMNVTVVLNYLINNYA